MKILLCIAFLSAAADVSAAQAGAQDLSGFPRPAFRSAYGGTPVDSVPTPFSNGGTCVRMCEFDTTPCDPDYYKVADRRCNFNQRGAY